MGLFKNLFGGERKTPAASPASSPPATAADLSADPNLIKVYDGYGRELFLTRQQWRDSVLYGQIEKAWDDAEPLAAVVTQLLQDQFFTEAVSPAERLMVLAPEAERSAILLGVTYLKNQRPDDAERTLCSYADQHADSGLVLTNLAKVYAERGDTSRARDTLWQAVRIDPNQGNAIEWLSALVREDGGEDAREKTLRELSTVRGSWRPQLWLARAALGRNEIGDAIDLYRNALANAGEPSPPDLLMQMSGDLGNSGLLRELIDLTMPHYNAQTHGLLVGNNLIKACLESGQLDQARQLVVDLYAQKRPDWQQTLSYWDTEIAKKQVQTTALPKSEQLSVTMLSIDGPVWLPMDSPAAALFPRPSQAAGSICFLGGSAEVSNPGTEVRATLSDAVGRLSRSVPLFLAEQVFFGAHREVKSLVAWLLNGGQGFVLSGVEWSDEDAVEQAKQLSPPAEMVVVSHVIASTAPWEIKARIIRCSDNARLGEFAVTCTPADPRDTVFDLASEVVAAVNGATASRVPTPSSYDVPRGLMLGNYLLRLEQLLAARCAGMDGVRPQFLSGEREMVTGCIRLCVDQPQNVNARVLLIQMLDRIKKVNPAAVDEQRDAVQLLQRQHRLPDAAQTLVDSMLSKIFPG